MQIKLRRSSTQIKNFIIIEQRFMGLRIQTRYVCDNNKHILLRYLSYFLACFYLFIENGDKEEYTYTK